MMRDVFDGISVFIEAVEAGGFAKAADRLALTRSAVGKAIARLEQRLGVRLIQRTTRTLCLTEDGQQYYERCVRAVRELKAGEALLDSGRLEVAGRLRISMPVLFGRYCIAPLLREFARHHAKLELEMNFSDRRVDVIAESFDIVIRNGGLGSESSLRARRLVGQRKILCAAPTYLAQRGTPDTVEDVLGHDLLPYWRGDHALPWRLPDAIGRIAEVQVTGRMRLDDLEVIADAAAEGMGLAWLPHWLVDERIASGALVPLWTDRPPATVEAFAIWPVAQYLPLRCRMLIDLLATELPKRVA